MCKHVDMDEEGWCEGLLLTMMSCRYRVRFMGDAILLIFPKNAIVLCIMVISPPLVGAYCMYGHCR